MGTPLKKKKIRILPFVGGLDLVRFTDRAIWTMSNLGSHKNPYYIPNNCVHASPRVSHLISLVSNTQVELNSADDRQQVTVKNKTADVLP
jgi:hypothetical protein